MVLVLLTMLTMTLAHHSLEISCSDLEITDVAPLLVFPAAQD